MKIALFYSGYLPGEKYGGPVSSLYNLTELLGDDIEMFIICKNHDLRETVPYSGIHPGWNSVGKAKVLYLSDEEYGIKVFSDTIDDIKPDLIYVSSIFSAKQTYPLLSLAKKKGRPLLLAPRGELNNNALQIKKAKKKTYLFLLKLLGKLDSAFFQATSAEEQKNIIQNLGVKRNKVFLLPNVPAMPVYKEALDKKRGVLKMCFVGRIVKNKNLYIAIKAAVEAKERIYFDIYGAVQDVEYWETCKQLIETAPDNIKVKYCGVLSPSQMRLTYAKYDCLISPTRFENYGQSIVEAMLHDVPVIISRGTTPWDEIADYGVGYVRDIDNVAKFTEAINEIAFMDKEQYEELVKRLRGYCLKTFNFEKLKENYRDVFIEIERRGNKNAALQ